VDFFPVGFPTDTLHAPLCSPIRAIYPAYLTYRDFITQLLFGEENRSCNYWAAHHLPVLKMKIPNRNQNVYFVCWMNMKYYTTVVGIATRYGLDGPGIESRWEREFPHLSRPALGTTQPSIKWIPGVSRG